MRPLYTLLGVATPFDPSLRFVTSWLLPTSIHFAIRALISLYIFVTLFFVLGWNDSHNAAIVSRQSFSYFTILTYWGLAFYFLFASIHTFSAWRTSKRGDWQEAYLLQNWPRSLQAAHSVYYSTVVTYPILVTIVFWAVLYSGPWFPVVFTAWSNVSEHALNSVFCLFEIIFPRTTPPPPLHVLFIVLILAFYLCLAYIIEASQGFYPYSFLDPSRGSGRTAGYIVGILAAALIIFGVVWFLIWLRVRLTEGRKSRKRRSVQHVELVEHGFSGGKNVV